MQKQHRFANAIFIFPAHFLLQIYNLQLTTNQTRDMRHCKHKMFLADLLILNLSQSDTQFDIAMQQNAKKNTYKGAPKFESGLLWLHIVRRKRWSNANGVIMSLKKNFHLSFTLDFKSKKLTKVSMTIVKLFLSSLVKETQEPPLSKWPTPLPCCKYRSPILVN